MPQVNWISSCLWLPPKRTAVGRSSITAAEKKKFRIHSVGQETVAVHQFFLWRMSNAYSTLSNDNFAADLLSFSIRCGFAKRCAMDDRIPKCLVNNFVINMQMQLKKYDGIKRVVNWTLELCFILLHRRTYTHTTISFSLRVSFIIYYCKRRRLPFGTKFNLGTQTHTHIRRRRMAKKYELRRDWCLSFEHQR